jgi:hypothetical protein
MKERTELIHSLLPHDVPPHFKTLLARKASPDVSFQTWTITVNQNIPLLLLIIYLVLGIKI